MDLRQLAALVAVADHGTFSAAADALHTVQSNVSAHIARLERELGAVLVDRSAGQLTEEGTAVVARARRVAAEVEAIASDVAALRQEVAGAVRLGMIGTTGRWLAPRIVAALGERHPQVRLSVMEGTSVSLEPRLVTGELDVAVMNLPVPSPELIAEPLFDEDLVLVVAAGDPRARRDHLRLEDLDGAELLLPVPGTVYRRELDRAAEAAGVRFRAIAELDGVRLIASLTFEGHGPAILPASAVPQYLREDWVSVPVTGLPRRRVGVATRRKGRPGAPVRAVLGLLGELVGDPAARPAGVHPPDA